MPLESCQSSYSAQKLAEYVIQKLPDLEKAKLDVEYDYPSVPLCVIDAVFSIGVRYESVRRTVKRFCDAHGWGTSRAEDPHEHTISEFISLIEPCVDRLGELFGNFQRTSTRSGILKAEATYRFAQTLQKFKIDTISDARERGKNSELRRRIQMIPGQTSGLSFAYFLILIGFREIVKPDRMIRRFVAAALNKITVSQDCADRLLIEASSILQVTYSNLTPAVIDNAIWKYQREQPKLRMIRGAA